jgi:hypothetical protein
MKEDEGEPHNDAGNGDAEEGVMRPRRLQRLREIKEDEEMNE